MPSNGIAGSYGNAVSKFLRNRQTIFHTNYAILYLHQQRTKQGFSFSTSFLTLVIFYFFNSGYPNDCECKHFFFKFIDATHWLDCGFGTVTAPLGPQSFDVKVRVGWLLWSLRMEVTFGEGEGTKDEPAHLLTLLRMNEQSTES